MKKTIISLAIACMVSAASAAEIITLAPSEGTITTNGASQTITDTEYSNSFTQIECNLGANTSNYWTWTTTFSLGEASNYTSLEAILFTCNSGGATQNSAKTGTFTFTLLDGDTQIFSSGAQNVTYCRYGTSAANNQGTPGDYGHATSIYAASADFDDANGNNGFKTGSGAVGSGAVISYTCNELLEANKTYTLQLKVQSNEGQSGYFVGIQNARVVSVPEPATATLSLLALAGLAARRRRK